MKQFTTLKVGYTTGAYGCSGEYFTAILINGKKTGYIRFSGLYGAEERVRAALEAKGWKYFYTPSVFGKMKKSEDATYFNDEHVVVKQIKSGEFITNEQPNVTLYVS